MYLCGQSVVRLLLLLLTTNVMATSAVNSGVKMRLTSKGITYASSIAEAAIKAELQSLHIPDQSGQDGHLSWSLTNIQTQSVNSPSSQITLDPQQEGLTWVLSNFGISLKADWHAKYKKAWIKVSDHGSVSVGLHDVSLTLTAGFGQKDERPSIYSKSCSASIGDVSIDFHGGTAVIWNLFKGILERKFRDLLQTRICEIVVKLVNEDANQALSKMKVYIQIDNCFLLDYGLVAAPVITSTYLEVLNKGEFYWAADKQECPFSPDAIPPWSEDDSMLYVWLTEYAAKTFAYVAHNHGYLRYNLTNKNLPGDQAGYLNTTCSKMCIGKVIPQIAKEYPDSWVELQIKSTAVPTIQITTENITSSAWADIDLVAHTPDGSTHYLLTLNVSLSLTVQASIADEKLVVVIVGDRKSVV